MKVSPTGGSQHEGGAVKYLTNRQFLSSLACLDYSANYLEPVAYAVVSQGRKDAAECVHRGMST